MAEAHLDEWTYGTCDCCIHGGRECAKLCCCMLCAYVRSLELVGITTRKRCCLCVWFFSCCLCCNRGRVRRRYLIQGKPGTDFACAYCCCPCDCFRVMLEIQHREDRYVTWFYGVREGYREHVNSLPCTGGQVAPEGGEAGAAPEDTEDGKSGHRSRSSETATPSASEESTEGESTSSSSGGPLSHGGTRRLSGNNAAWASPTAEMAR